MPTKPADPPERPTRRRSVLAALLAVPLGAGVSVGPVFAAAAKRREPAPADTRGSDDTRE